MTKNANEIRNTAKPPEFVFGFVLKDTFSTSFEVGNGKKWFCAWGLSFLPLHGLQPAKIPARKVLAHLLAVCLGLGTGSGSEEGMSGASIGVVQHTPAACTVPAGMISAVTEKFIDCFLPPSPPLGEVKPSMG